jgi:hypothetical protein
MAMKTENQSKHEVGQAFVEHHQSEVIGVLHGWDRLRLQGTLRSLYYAPVMEQYLRKAGVLWKDFKSYAIGLTGRICQAAEELGKQYQRPVIYLASSQASKEDEARRIGQRDGIKSGLIVVMSCVEPCRTWRMRGNHETKRLELRLEWGKCKHLYFYWEHEELGFMHLRLQTWFPFSIQVCVNGREWLGRQMDKEGMAYRQEDNCFPWIADVGRAQELMEEQHRTDWPKVLEDLVKRCHRVHEEIRRPIELGYYWTASQSEYASDVMFRDRGALERIYPPLVHHAVMHMGAEQVMRYMGRSGRVGINDAVVTDRRRRSEGVRVKHWLNQNSLKFYDKGSVLRDEVTINEPKDFRVWRGAENKPQSKWQWRELRRSVADFGRRAEVSRKATDRHLTALAAVEIDSPLGQEAAKVCRAVGSKKGRHRALNPMGDADGELMAAVSRGEYAINGIRNRDVRVHLYGVANDKQQERKEMAAVGRKLRLLRAHGLIAKVSKTHRYMVTKKGRRIMTALLAARQASTEKLSAMAA